MKLVDILVFLSIIRLIFTADEFNDMEILSRRIHKRPKYYINGITEYPTLLFADAIFTNDGCVTLTSRYHSDKRRSFDIKTIDISFSALQYFSDSIDKSDFKRLRPVSWIGNAIGMDTPVLQIRFCDESFREAAAVEMKISDKKTFVTNVLVLPKLNNPFVDIAACSMSSLDDLWSARAWIEHNREIGVGRFTIFVNDIIPKPDKSAIGSNVKYLLSQPDVALVEWPYPFKDPNTTRDQIKAPMHYARPLEWNSCNEREHYGSKVTLFDDMDEFVVMNPRLKSMLHLVDLFPSTCPAIQLGHYWVKVKCDCKQISCPHAFDSLSSLQKCRVWRQEEFSLDSKRRTKMIIRTERGDVHTVLNHNLASPLPAECVVTDPNIASLYHILNLRENNKHASAGRLHDLNTLLRNATVPVKIPDRNIITRDTSSKIKGNGKKLVYLTLTTSPSRIQYIPKVLGNIDLSSAKVIINLPAQYGSKGERYSDISIARLRDDPRNFLNIIPEDLGPYTKVIPTFDLIQDSDAIIISIDDDTVYPSNLISIMMNALSTTNFESVVALCGVNVSSWGIDTACGSPGPTDMCLPFDYKSKLSKNTQVNLTISIPDNGVRELTAVDVLKGFTGIAYPRKLITPQIIKHIEEWSALTTLETDLLHGLSAEACSQSDDYVISAALQAGGVKRYRLSRTDDCREGLGQYEYGFGKNALMMKDGGHTAKYFACARSISEWIAWQQVVGGMVVDSRSWPQRDFSSCGGPVLTAAKLLTIAGRTPLSMRWKMPWYKEPHYSKSYEPPTCWRNAPSKSNALSSAWHCPFPLTLPAVNARSVQTHDGFSVIPLQYAFQLNRMPASLRPLEKDWSVIWPVQARSRFDKIRGYTFSDEASYYQEYGSSLFAYTYRKGGWDSMRHYEIMCNGGIPYFIGLSAMPAHTMTLFPRELVNRTMSLPGISPSGVIDKNSTDMKCLEDVRNAIFSYCRSNLTTIALARYFLRAMNKVQAKRILMINGRNQWDYLTDSLFHGLRSLLGNGLVDVEKRHFMYKRGQAAARKHGFIEYGKGFSYAYGLPDDKSIDRRPASIASRIRNHDFDVIIFGQLHQPVAGARDWDTSTNLSHQLYWKDVTHYYKAGEIAFLDGLDRHREDQRKTVKEASLYGKVFVREIGSMLIDGVDDGDVTPPGAKLSELMAPISRRKIDAEKVYLANRRRKKTTKSRHGRRSH